MSLLTFKGLVGASNGNGSSKDSEHYVNLMINMHTVQ
jgi:hypothetical protein